MANDDMILSFIEGDKKLELSIKGYEFDEYFKQIKGEFDTSDQDSEWLMIKAVFRNVVNKLSATIHRLKFVI